MRNKKLLIIDFDKESLYSLSRFLEAEGFKIVTSNDGLAGLEMFLAENPHLVILEAMLPRLDGFDLCTKITTAFPTKVPVIIISGVYRDSLSKTEALRSCGASAFFPKPVKKEELLNTILDLLNLRAPEKGIEVSKAPLPVDSLEILSQQSLKAFQATPKPEDGRKKKLDDLIDRELKEAFGTLTIKSKEKEKRVKKQGASPEIDNILKDTLAEFGLKPEKKKSAAVAASKPTNKKDEFWDQIPALAVPEHKKKANPERQERKPELEALRGALKVEPKKPEPQPGHKPERKPEPKEATRPVPQEPPIEVGSFAEKRLSQTSPYDKYAEKKKTQPPPRVMIFGLAVLVVVGSVFVFFRPRKHASPPPVEQTALQTADIQNTGLDQQAQNNPPVVAEKPTPKKDNPQKIPPAKKDVQNVGAGEATTDKIEPLLPTSIPNFQTQMTGQKPADSPAGTQTSENQPKGNAGDQQLNSGAEKPAEGEPAADTAANPAITKLGDLVPLGQAATPPQVLKMTDPVYPPLALQREIQGTVTVNALVSENGDVLQVAILNSQVKGYGLEKATEAAVRKWKFKPATKDGVNVRVWKPLAITFKTPKKITRD